MLKILFLIPLIITFACGRDDKFIEDEETMTIAPIPLNRETTERKIIQPVTKLVSEDVTITIEKDTNVIIVKDANVYIDTLNVKCRSNNDEKSCKNDYFLETNLSKDPNLLISFTAEKNAVDSNSGEVRFEVPRLFATCTTRCPNYITLNFEIQISNDIESRLVTPTELDQKSIQIVRDCTERLSYVMDHAGKRDANTPPCIYEFLPYTRRFTYPIAENAKQNRYSFQISRDRNSSKTIAAPRSLVIEAPITFEWRNDL